jgi:hypothetical protein
MDSYKSVSSIVCVCVCVLFREFVLLPYLWASGEEFPSMSFFWFLGFDSCFHTKNFSMKNNVRNFSKHLLCFGDCTDDDVVYDYYTVFPFPWKSLSLSLSLYPMKVLKQACDSSEFSLNFQREEIIIVLNLTFLCD